MTADVRIGTAIHHRTANSYMRTPVPDLTQTGDHDLSLACWCGPLAFKVMCRFEDAHEHEGWDRPHFLPGGRVIHVL